MTTVMSYFRLFGLPLDLLEFLTLYFEGNEAVKVLTVSSNFHEIFARSVWHTITRATIDVAEPTRSGAFARYGHLVRSIYLSGKLHSEFGSHSWAQLFPNTTLMVFDISSEMKDVDKQTFMDAVAGFHGLRLLKINMRTNVPPYDLKTLATVLVARHGDPSKRILQVLTIYFGIGYEEEDKQTKSWADLSAVVQTISPLRPSISLQIDMSGYYSTIFPTPAQMKILGPHLTNVPIIDELETEYGCRAIRNRQIFSPIGSCDDPLVFGQLRELRLRVCCLSPHLYDYSDFTPAKFPVMESMMAADDVCSHRSGGASSAINNVLLQQWSKLKDLILGGGCWLTPSTMDKLVELNPQLKHLNTGLSRNTVGTDDVFMLERVAGRLPHLTSFILQVSRSTLVDSDWLQATSLVDIRSSKLTHVQMAGFKLGHRLFEVLLALPNLQMMVFSRCTLAEPELVMNVFKKHRHTAKEDATAGIGYLTISTPLIDSNWSAELVLEMVAALPHLQSCTIRDKGDIKSVIKEKYPKLII
ncbi:hypothetical protein GQ42DRAFT_36001 [Ramicandelaber brevisporus]|nr:hypothetical protein GQ42DRAFT_36001 [Ramicandelaber brevisporus]